VIVGVGLDIVSIARVAAMLSRHGARAEAKLFSASERADCRRRGRPEQHFAARFAAKEATIKALGAPEGLRWQEMQIHSEANGRPRLVLSGFAAAAAERRGTVTCHVTLTHADDVAAAVVILEGA
jgi:holo-[acyl-carrier protein] synthase